MDQEILVGLDNAINDRPLIPHSAKLAKMHGSKLLLLHLSDGGMARNYNRFQLAESDETKDDRVASDLRGQELIVETDLALVEPAGRILQTVAEQNCNLIALTTRGHRFLQGMLDGSTITQVRHRNAHQCR